jgi:hypothetical protein
LDIPDDHRTGSDYSSIPDLPSRPNEGIGANPNVIAYDDRRFQERKGSLLIVVRSRAEMGPLGNGGAGSDRYPPKIIDQGVLTNSRIFPDFQIPWEINVGGSVAIDPGTYLRPEAAQEKAAESEAGPRGQLKDQTPRHPRHTPELLGAGILNRSPVFCNGAVVTERKIRHLLSGRLIDCNHGTLS